MKKYTYQEFCELPRNECGYKICPSGDYTEIKNFGEWCSFGEYCSFGERCSFGAWCSFGEGCSFGKHCSFGERCNFGKYCNFGEWCSFGERCNFGEYCSFGAWCGLGEHCNFGRCCSFGELCSFGDHCSFDKWCSFGELCSFGEHCSFEGLTNSKYIAVDRIGSKKHKTYFFAADEGLFVRAGDFFGTIDEFENRVHDGTKHEAHYMKAIELARLMLAEEDCRVRLEAKYL